MVKPDKYYNKFFNIGYLLLFRRAFLCAERTIHTAICLFWTQHSLTIFTLVEKLAGICRHFFSFLVSTNRASYRGQRYIIFFHLN
jgi:hypothetical protein